MIVSEIGTLTVPKEELRIQLDLTICGGGRELTQAEREKITRVIVDLIRAAAEDEFALLRRPSGLSCSGACQRRL